MVVKYSLAVLKHGSLWAYRLATAAVLLAGAVFMVLVLGLRYYVLPNIDAYRAAIEDAVSQATGQKVAIGAVHGSWKGYRPELDLADVKVFDDRGEVAFQLDRVEAVLAWVSLLSAQVRFDSIEVRGPRVDVRRDAQGGLHVAGIAVDQGPTGGGLGDWLLAQRQILIREATIVWIDELRGAPELRVENVNFRLDSAHGRHAFGLTGTLPAALASQVDVRGTFHGRRIAHWRDWTARIYADFPRVSLAMAPLWVEAPIELSGGVGSLRVWLDVAQGRIAAATADLGLANVRARLAPALPELGLTSLSGRLFWKQSPGRRELAGRSLAFATAEGLALAPMDFSYVQTGDAPQARRSELKVARLDLAPIAGLAAFLPLEPEVHDWMAAAAPAGMVREGEFAWMGDFDRKQPYRIHAAFSGLQLRAIGAAPGVRKLDGEVEASDQGGTATLAMTEGGFDLPRVFGAPVPMEVLSAALGWRFQGGQAWVTVRNVAFTNEHAAGTFHGTYHTEAQGPGVIDLTGSLVRADGRYVWRYIPLSAPITREWLKRALIAGESREARFRLKGRLADFPFDEGKAGVFEIAARFTGAALEYAPGWPAVTNASGDLVFRGRRMEIRPRDGEILGVRLSDAVVSIDELGRHDEHLLVRGKAHGPTSEFLRFVSSSPVGARIDHFTDGIRARGEANLALELDLDLHRMEESKVRGELVVADNQVVIDPRVPELDRFNARVAFTRDGSRAGFTLRDGRALMLGNAVTFDAANQADGAVSAKLAGSLEAARVAELANYAPLHLLGGKLAWTGNVTVRNRIASLRFDSDLTGLSSRLPAPFAKAAEAKLPLRVELLERPGRQGVLVLGLGGIVSAQLALDGGAGGLRRGMIGMGGIAATLPDGDGLVIRGRIDQLDLDAWNAVLRDTGKGGTAPLIAAIDLEIGSLDLGRRRFHDLSIDVVARRNTWQGTVDGEEVAGDVSWSAEGNGRLVARLARLALPAPASNVAPPQPMAGESLPMLDVVAESFVFEGKNLGKLIVRANPDPGGWALQRLEAASPDGKLAASGRWNTDGEQRTDVKVRLDVSDIGKYFARLGYPEGVTGGKGSLEGPISWKGGPTRLDIRSLSGRLKLEAKEGRFQQVNPGVAKLLGIISLQSLPRRLTLDFDDIFRKGFTFDSISANLEIASGIVHTGDFQMQGSAARVAMHGTVDLAAETQNLTLRVIPSLSESIAVAGAIVNPAVGVAALIAQKALKDPFSSMAALEYSLTGSWSEPVVARIPRGGDKAQEKGR
ncbi:MAG TPA: YhdP family protein [Burkholderiales bacterium]|nr:YhdP family protein [Burkholderiales bacterium]